VLETQTIQGRKIGAAEITEITGLIQGNPQWSRRQLSQVLAERWHWYAASGQLKDMAARTLLLKLHERGFVVLPERRQTPVARRSDPDPDLFERRIDKDWQRRYGHPIHLLETFVQGDRFRGTCYQAANWIHVGQTTGRTRQSQRYRDNAVHAPVKDIYLYPLTADARRHLCR
jgi:hypothetical protein